MVSDFRNLDAPNIPPGNWDAPNMTRETHIMVTRVNICQLQWCHPKFAQRNELIWGGFLGGGNSSIFYVHLYLGRIPSLTIIFFRWVETTN